jgi:hypothetical protein
MHTDVCVAGGGRRGWPLPLPYGVTVVDCALVAMPLLDDPRRYQSLKNYAKPIPNRPQVVNLPHFHLSGNAGCYMFRQPSFRALTCRFE